jgi:choline dehydrogenase-like flavoprotein
MKLDAGKAEDRKTINDTFYDICIIGSGAAGLAMAHSLIDWSKQNNKKVLVLEASRRNDKGSTITPNHRYEDHDLQPIYDGVMVESDGFPAGISREGKTSREFFLASRIKAYGGTTNCWQGWTVPHDDVDASSDPKWPVVVRKELNDTYYGKAMFYCSLGNWTFPAAYQASYWPIEATHYSNDKLELMDDVGDWGLRNEVVVQIGGERGKEPPDNDRAWSFQLRWGPDIEKAKNVFICRNANVRLLSFSGGGVFFANATTVKDGPVKGDDFKVIADKYVLATGCVENVRLLFHSLVQSGLNPEKQLPLLGKYLMTHPLVEVAGYFEAKETAKLTKEKRRYYAGAGINTTDFPPSVMAMLTPTPKLVADKKIGNFRAWLNFGEEKAASWSGPLNLCWEVKPSADNYVALDLQSKDRLFGDPLPRVRIALGETDRRTREVAFETVQHFLTDKKDKQNNDRVPYSESCYPIGNLPKVTGEHAMGGTRFSDNANTGVVDSNCKVYSMTNLYVAGGSLFPTGGWANPTLTIIALALRLAKHLQT